MSKIEFDWNEKVSDHEIERVCPNCEGNGQFYTYEDCSDYSSKKIYFNCEDCDGSGLWKDEKIVEKKNG